MPIVYQLGADGHRGSAAIRRLVEHAPSTGALALWMQHRDVERFVGAERCETSPIATDGLTVWYRPAFESRPLDEQTALVAHQVLHVAFRHVARGDALARTLGQLDADLWNLVTDALVNASLVRLDWMRLPDGSVALDRLLAESLGIHATAEVSLARWDAESLYRAVDDRRATRSGQPRTERDDGASSDGASTDGDGSRDRMDRREDGPRAAAARQLARAMLPDLLPGTEAAPEREADAARTWHERLGRAHVADGSRSLLRTLGADHRPARTPWQHVLRRRLARAMAPVPELSWSRPTRHWLAARGRTRSGRRLPREPGHVSTGRATRVVVVVDVSGSIDERRLGEFASEMDRLSRLHRGDVMLIVGDERVRHEQRLRPGSRTLATLGIEGGDGTDFRPLLAAAMRHRPDLVVVLTDLDGPAGAAPDVEVLWATPAEAPAPTPFGSRLRLD